MNFGNITELVTGAFTMLTAVFSALGAFAAYQAKKRASGPTGNSLNFLLTLFLLLSVFSLGMLVTVYFQEHSPLQRAELMEAVIDVPFNNKGAQDEDERVKDEAASVFGSPSVRRGEILSVTFLPDTRQADRSAWDVSERQDGTVLAWLIPRGDAAAGFDLFIGSDKGVIYAPRNCDKMFFGYANAEYIDFNNVLKTSHVTSMESMFNNCSSLTRLNVGGFDTANVKNMAHMFYNCWLLPELDVSGFRTSQVEDFSGMFFECDSIARLDVSHFSTESAKSLKSMFRGCRNLTRLDISGFNTGNVTEMSSLFHGCKSLETIYIEERTQFVTGQLPDGHGQNVFRDCVSLRGLGGVSNGTAYEEVSYSESHVDTAYAVINNAEHKGYFTEKPR